MKVRTARGFTLVELLVVISIISMLMALLLPAVQQARESGRRLACSNNVKQLATAIRSYETQFNRFPGYVNELQGQRASWVVMILPFLEELELWDQWNDSNTTNNSTPSMDVLICPSDPPETTGGGALAYCVNAGFGTNSNTQDWATSGGNPANGIFLDMNPWTDAIRKSAPQVNVNYLNVKDGSTNTLLLSENVQLGSWGNEGSDNKELYGFCWHTNTSTVLLINKELTDAGAVDLQHARPAAYHPGGVNVAFGDLHVKFLTENVDHNVFMQLCTSDSRNSDIPTGDRVLLDDSAY